MDTMQLHCPPASPWLSPHTAPFSLPSTLKKNSVKSCRAGRVNRCHIGQLLVPFSWHGRFFCELRHGFTSFSSSSSARQLGDPHFSAGKIRLVGHGDGSAAIFTDGREQVGRCSSAASRCPARPTMHGLASPRFFVRNRRYQRRKNSPRWGRDDDDDDDDTR